MKPMFTNRNHHRINVALYLLNVMAQGKHMHTLFQFVYPYKFISVIYDNLYADSRTITRYKNQVIFVQSGFSISEVFFEKISNVQREI